MIRGIMRRLYGRLKKDVDLQALFEERLPARLSLM